MRISSRIARIATGGMAAGLVGGLCLVLGAVGSRPASAPEPAFAFDGTTSPAPRRCRRPTACAPARACAGGRSKAKRFDRAAICGRSGRSRSRNGSSAACTPRATACRSDDLRAFNYFSQIANTHPDEAPGTPQARFVANAFVALGHYYLTGIPNSKIDAGSDSRARDVRLCRHLFRRCRRAIRTRPALSRRHAERSAPGGALVPACRHQGPLPRRRRRSATCCSRAKPCRAKPRAA